MTRFRVQLEAFRGPLDLLLYLVRKHEVDIVDLPVAPITDQYLEYIEALQQLDVDGVGDFLEMASTLVEIKSRHVLPRGGEEEDEPLDDPRRELVQRLLEYKQFKEAASLLDERGRAWQSRFPRMAGDLAAAPRNLADEPLHEVELWDLVSAFSRVMREHVAPTASNIVYDDTPIHVFMDRIRESLAARGPMPMKDLFQQGMHKSTLVGIFLAVLELVRNHGLEARQDAEFGEVWLHQPV